jgi:hypothetical protein
MKRRLSNIIIIQELIGGCICKVQNKGNYFKEVGLEYRVNEVITKKKHNPEMI